MDAELVAAVRSFNRTVTERVGALHDHYLARDRPLGEARLLWEIGDGRDLRTLRAALGLDSGYLSRLLRALEADGLVTVTADEADRRVRVARLTAVGKDEREALDRRSDDAAAAILAPLTERQQQRLVAAMAEVSRLMRAGAVEIEAVDPTHPDVQPCFEAYFDDKNAAQYDLFNVKYVLLPNGQEPTVAATEIAQRGNYTLYEVATSGYLEVVDTTEPIAANNRDMAAVMRPYIESPALATRSRRSAGTRSSGTPSCPAGCARSARRSCARRCASTSAPS